MKILAIEKEMKTVDWKNESSTLVEEAKSVYKMILVGNLREIYFNENKRAILVLECDDKKTAGKLLEELPLVKKGLIDFEIMELRPYTGLSRLMNLK